MADNFDPKIGYELIGEKIEKIMAMVEGLQISPEQKRDIISELGAVAGICQANKKTPEEIARQKELESFFR